MQGRVKPAWTKHFGRQMDQGELRVGKLGNEAGASREALHRSCHLFPGVAPQMFVVVRSGQNTLDFRQHEFVRARLVFNNLSCKMRSEWRSGRFAGNRLVRRPELQCLL